MKVMIGPEEIKHPSAKNEMPRIRPPVVQTVMKKGNHWNDSLAKIENRKDCYGFTVRSECVWNIGKKTTKEKHHCDNQENGNPGTQSQISNEVTKQNQKWSRMSVGAHSRRVMIREESQSDRDSTKKWMQKKKELKQDICDFAHYSDRFK
jgi:hypothetical protein